MTEEVKEEKSISQNASPIQDEQSTTQENPEEINWRKFRTQQEELRKQNEEAKKLALQKEKEAEQLKKALEALVDRSEPKRYEEEEEEEDIVEKKVREALRKRDLEMEKKRIEQEKIEMPRRLQQAYSDFDKVMTDENVDYLAYHYPEIHTAFKNMPDNFESWTSLYKTLKRFIPNKESEKEAKKADSNLQKPVSISKGGLSSTADNTPSMHLGEDRKKANWERMQKILKGV